MSIHEIETNQSRSRAWIPSFLLVLACALVAAPAAAKTVEQYEKDVERAQEAVEKAQEALDEAGRAVEKAQKAVDDEIARLKKEAEDDPTAHGAYPELARLRKALEDAMEEQAEAEENLAKKKAALKRALERYLRKLRKDEKLDEATRKRKVADAEEKLGSLDESSTAASPTLPGARVVLTGTVVGGEEATLAVVGPQGQRLSGVVVDVDGEEHVTGADGRVAFAVAAALGTLRVAIPSLGDGPTVVVPVVGPPPESLTESPPRVGRVPRYPTSGGDLPISGGGFDGEATGNVVRVGDRELDVLASSPTGLVAAIPPDFLGDLGPLVVSTANGDSAPVELTFVRFGLAGDRTVLTRGQSAVRGVVVEGTSEPVPLRITNLTPSVVRMEGGDTLTTTTSGGTPNQAEIRITGVTRGDFELAAAVAPKPGSAEDWEAQAEQAAQDAVGDDPPDNDGDKTREGSAWSSAGHERSSRGEHEEAAEDFEKAAEAFDAAGRTAQADAERINAGTAWSRAGDAASDAGDQTRANECYENAARQFEAAGLKAQAAGERAKKQ
jgi:tetratricopeptide (TPR) repeat protein